MMLRPSPLALAGIFAILIFGGKLYADTKPGKTSSKLFSDGIAAKVNGKVITKSEVQEAVAQQIFMAYRQIPDPKARDAKVEEIKEQGLKALIDKELILAEHDKRAGQPKDYMIENYEKRFIMDAYKGDREAFLADLRKFGITHRKFTEDRTKDFKVLRMQSAITQGLPPCSPAEVEEYYKKHLRDFQEEGQVKVRTIRVPKFPEPDPLDPVQLAPASPEFQKKLVTQLHAKLKNGANFAEIAKAHSTDSAAKDGGDRGWIDRKNTTLNEFLTAAALSLKEKEVGPIIEDNNNYYIIWAENRKYGKLTPLSEVRDQVEKRALAEKKNQMVQKWLQNLRSRAQIHIP